MTTPPLFKSDDANANDVPCQFLVWDTDFFGKRIGLVRGNYLTPERAQAIDIWAHENAVDCLYFLANTDNPPTIRLAEDAGFRFQSVRLWLERTLEDLDAIMFPPVEGLVLRPAQTADIEVLRPIARHSYTWTRFYNDPCFSEAQCEALYDIWLTRSIQREIADEVIVAEQDGVPVGYVTSKLNKTAEEQAVDGVIMLVGVGESQRGNKIGHRTMHATMVWLASQGVPMVSLATQGHNVAAVRFYERLGFTARSTQFWYHKWYQNC